MRRPPRTTRPATPFPYTTLFRSGPPRQRALDARLHQIVGVGGIARQPQREASQRWQQFAQFVVIDWIHGVAGPRTRGVHVLIAGLTRGGGVYSLPGATLPASGSASCRERVCQDW